MAFSKIGAPQEMKIITKCQICNVNDAKVFVNGQMICEECNSKQTN